VLFRPVEPGAALDGDPATAWRSARQLDPTGEFWQVDFGSRVGVGEITVRLERSLDHLRSNLNGTPRWHMTYRVDSDPRSFNEFRGVIENGVVKITEHKRLSILWNGLSAPVLNLNNAHLRLQMQSDGSVDGLLAGYQPWRELYFAFSHNGIVGDRPGLWHAMKKAADADPDPQTGLNLSISASYRISAVPAFVVPAEHANSFSAR